MRSGAKAGLRLAPSRIGTILAGRVAFWRIVALEIFHYETVRLRHAWASDQMLIVRIAAALNVFAIRTISI